CPTGRIRGCKADHEVEEGAVEPLLVVRQYPAPPSVVRGRRGYSECRGAHYDQHPLEHRWSRSRERCRHERCLAPDQGRNRLIPTRAGRRVNARVVPDAAAPRRCRIDATSEACANTSPVPKPVHSTGAESPEELPAYTAVRAAQIVRLSPSTLRLWARGDGEQAALFVPAERSPLTLSFSNLVETFVLASMRKVHGISMQRVRKALRFI